MARIELDGVGKTYGAMRVIDGLDLDIPDGEFTVFVGPSGCGKSTLLRMIAGLEEIDGGEVRIGGRRANELSPNSRGVAMVFQNYALYPHMTVEENIGFGLKMARRPTEEIRERVSAAAASLHITQLLGRRPAELSGGQRQRVAIGRSIVREPTVFLFDEPLSNLDAELRVGMRLELSELHERLGATMIYVTHDQLEAMTMADRIVVLRGGRVEQVGTPMELYRQPANLFVAGFIGSPRMNLIEGPEAERRGAAAIGIRPEHLRIAAEGPWSGTVNVAEQLGSDTYLHVQGSGLADSLTVRGEGDLSLRHGDAVRLALDEERIHRFDAQGLRID